MIKSFFSNRMHLFLILAMLSGCETFDKQVSTSTTLQGHDSQPRTVTTSYDKDVSITKMVSEFRGQCLASVSKSTSELIKAELAADEKWAEKNMQTEAGEVAQQMARTHVETIRSQRPNYALTFAQLMSGTCSEMSDYYKLQLARVEGKTARQAVRHATFRDLGGKIIGAAKSVGLAGAAVTGAHLLSGGTIEINPQTEATNATLTN